MNVVDAELFQAGDDDYLRTGKNSSIMTSLTQHHSVSVKPIVAEFEFYELLKITNFKIANELYDFVLF